MLKRKGTVLHTLSFGKQCVKAVVAQRLAQLPARSAAGRQEDTVGKISWSSSAWRPNCPPDRPVLRANTD